MAFYLPGDAVIFVLLKNFSFLILFLSHFSGQLFSEKSPADNNIETWTRFSIMVSQLQVPLPYLIALAELAAENSEHKKEFLHEWNKFSNQIDEIREIAPKLVDSAGSAVSSTPVVLAAAVASAKPEEKKGLDSAAPITSVVPKPEEKKPEPMLPMPSPQATLATPSPKPSEPAATPVNPSLNLSASATPVLSPVKPSEPATSLSDSSKSTLPTPSAPSALSLPAGLSQPLALAPSVPAASPSQSLSTLPATLPPLAGSSSTVSAVGDNASMPPAPAPGRPPRPPRK